MHKKKKKKKKKGREKNKRSLLKHAIQAIITDMRRETRGYVKMNSSPRKPKEKYAGGNRLLRGRIRKRREILQGSIRGLCRAKM